MALFLRISPLLQLNAKAAQTTLRLISSNPIKPSSLFQSKLTSPKLVVNNFTRKASTASHSGSKHWSAERIVGAALIAIIPVALIADNQITDGLLASSLMIHVWWGLQQVVLDYKRKLHLPQFSFAILNLICAAALVGLLYFNYADIGLSRAIKKIWSL